MNFGKLLAPFNNFGFVLFPFFLKIGLMSESTTTSNKQQLKRINTLYHTVSEGEGSLNNLAGWMALKFSQEVAVRTSAGAVLSEGLTRVGKLTCKGFITQLLEIEFISLSVLHNSSSVSCHMVLSTRLLMI